MGIREITARYRRAQWTEIFQERIDSGETIETLCLRKGLSKHQYYYRLRMLRKEAGEQFTEQPKETADIAIRGFTEVRLAESPMSLGTVGSDQICIETSFYRLTAGSRYPSEALVTVLREIMSR